MLADFICERGPERVVYSGQDGLTLEVARSRVIHDLRMRFYDEGNIPRPGDSREYQFNPPEYALAVEDVLVGGELLPIMHFIGSFDYSIKGLLGQGGGYERVLFRVDNQTDLASGTHIPGQFPTEAERLNPLTLEQAISNEPGLAQQSAIDVILNYRDQRDRPIVALLRPLRREQTGGQGGGAMQQTFFWSERYLSCGLQMLPWPVVLLFTDVQ